MNRKGGAFEQGLVLTGVILVSLLFGFGLFYRVAYALTSGAESITVKEKWVKYQSNDAKYLVSSTDGQVFEVSDSFIYWRFDSSNLYAYLEPGMSCVVETQGWRLPLLSDYKNIVEARCDPAAEEVAAS